MLETALLIVSGVGCIAYAIHRVKREIKSEFGPEDGVYYTYYLPLVWSASEKARNLKGDPSVSVTLYVKDGYTRVSSSDATDHDKDGLSSIKRWDPLAYTAIKAWLDGVTTIDPQLLHGSGYSRLKGRLNKS